MTHAFIRRSVYIPIELISHTHPVVVFRNISSYYYFYSKPFSISSMFDQDYPAIATFSSSQKKEKRTKCLPTPTFVKSLLQSIPIRTQRQTLYILLFPFRKLWNADVRPRRNDARKWYPSRTISLFTFQLMLVDASICSTNRRLTYLSSWSVVRKYFQVEWLHDSMHTSDLMGDLGGQRFITKHRALLCMPSLVIDFDMNFVLKFFSSSWLWVWKSYNEG